MMGIFDTAQRRRRRREGGRRTAAAGGSLERRWLSDRLALAGDAHDVIPADGSSFSAAGIRVIAPISVRRSRLDLRGNNRRRPRRDAASASARGQGAHAGRC
jgi:hypothetical protein